MGEYLSDDEELGRAVFHNPFFRWWRYAVASHGWSPPSYIHPADAMGDAQERDEEQLCMAAAAATTRE